MKGGLVATVVVLAFTGQLWAANSAVEFNGTNGNIEIAGTADMNPTGAFTLEAWIYPETVNDVQDIIYKWSAGYSGQRSYFLQVGSGATIHFTLSTTGERYEGRYGLTSTTTVEASQWTHVAGVYDGSTMAIYLNGVVQPNTLSVTGNVFDGSAPVFIGGTGSETYEPFDGIIDEVRISDVARYTADFDLQQSEFSPDADTFVLMHLDEGIGTTTANLGIHGGNGTLNSGASWVTEGAPVPEPATLSLLILGGAGLLMRRRRLHNRSPRR